MTKNHFIIPTGLKMAEEMANKHVGAYVPSGFGGGGGGGQPQPPAPSQQYPPYNPSGPSQQPYPPYNPSPSTTDGSSFSLPQPSRFRTADCKKFRNQVRKQKQEFWLKIDHCFEA